MKTVEKKSKTFTTFIGLVALTSTISIMLAAFIFWIFGAFDVFAASQRAPAYSVVDTNQNRCFAINGAVIPCSSASLPGQDGAYQGLSPAYQDNGDGTITDLNTGLVWQKTPNFDRKMTFSQAKEFASELRLGGHDDWRVPTMKELYSLMDFSGSSPLGRPYINTEHFDFIYGRPHKNERYIDAQYWSSTAYDGKVFGRAEAAFGVNFADGRIKAYPRHKSSFVRYVRGSSDYGINQFMDNGDGTVTDHATGLMWQQTDSTHGMNWPGALQYAQNLTLGGYSDWRLPNAKELHSIVDYSRSPQAGNPAKRGAALNGVFNANNPDAWHWSSTTLLEGWGEQAVYFAFGPATGIIHGRKMDVHGAGAQRGDPKTGDPRHFPYGRGPQGDEIRIFNHVRCVRDAENFPVMVKN